MKRSNVMTHKILLCVLLGTLGALAVIYLGFSFYFSNHFFFRTEINGLPVSCKSDSAVEQMLADEVTVYQLQLEGRNHLTDTISADQISLAYQSNGAIQDTLSAQNPFLWPASIFKKNTLDIVCGVTYDERALENRCKASVFLQEENIVAPKNATIKYLDHQGYYIINEDPGATIAVKPFLAQVKQSISTLEESLNLDRAGCYKEPAIKSSSKKLTRLYDKLQKFCSTEITYTFGSAQEVVNGDNIHKWIKINKKKATATIQEEKVQQFLTKIASKHDTVGSTRYFKASTGHKVSVSGGDYGWKMDQEAETGKLISLIKKGAIKTRTPAYARKGAKFGQKDWGKTYVEINLSKQHLWFYKNGSLVVDSDLVSGCVNNGNATPAGAYYILYKKTDYVLGVLSNASYRTFVHYWMPFNGGIGLHDAYWRRSFGGSIYINSGSHGCINLPSNVAATIYQSIDVGTPVICYHDSGSAE